MDASSSSSSPLSQQCRQFTISEIHLATQNFDESLIIGRGGFGRVYKGTITDGATHLVVAIKRLDSTSTQGASEFWNEVQMLSKLRHCHLVSLIGYCNDGQEMVLVYEYMPHGTLEDHLHKFRMYLTWVQRLKICIGAARGLDHLHTGTGIKHGIIHRDVKSSNILLDDSWAAKISDFGLSKIGPINQPSTYVNTFVKGTFGYLDPDYFATGRLTRKSDVYAFGVVLFEVLSGKRAVDKSLDDEHWGLVNWAQESMKEGRLKQIVDYDIRERILPKCLKEFARIAERCLHSKPKQRPSMAEVVVCLESVLALQEKASNILHPEGMTIFGNMVPLSIFWSNGDNYVGGKSLNPLEEYFDTIGGEIRMLRKFEFETIKAATENFAHNNTISVDSFDPIMYKGRLQNGQGVSIARYSSDFQFKNEVSLLVQLEHENLLQLLGYCIQGPEVFLVYEFEIYESLCRLIDDPSCALLDWNKRTKIILAVARVLLYLHQHAPIRIIHSDITAIKILLDDSLEPKLSSFGLARCLAIDEADCIKVDVVRGTSAYMAPEYMTRGHLSTKVDVFGFGVLILEIISGRRNYIRRDEMNFEEFVWKNWLEGTCSNIMDPRIHANSSSITRFIQIGLLCVQDDATHRPTMEEVLAMLTSGSSLILPIPFTPTSVWREVDSDYSYASQILVTDDYDSGAIEEFILEICPR